MDAVRNNRAEHFFAYKPNNESKKMNKVGVQDSVIGCDKRTVRIGGKTEAIIVFKRISIDKFNRSESAKQSAARALQHIETFLRANGMTDVKASQAITGLRRESDINHMVTLDAVATETFEKVAVRVLNMPVISSLSKKTDAMQSAETIHKVKLEEKLANKN